MFASQRMPWSLLANTQQRQQQPGYVLRVSDTGSRPPLLNIPAANLLFIRPTSATEKEIRKI